MLRIKQILFVVLISLLCNYSFGVDIIKNRFQKKIVPVKAIKLEIENKLSYDEILKISKEQNKKIFVFFYIDSCYWCHKMIDETLANESCRLSLKDYLIYYYNCETEPKNKNIKTFPSYQVIDCDENVIKHGQKFIKPNDFIRWIKN